jgi:hypothetical protein
VSESNRNPWQDRSAFIRRLAAPAAHSPHNRLGGSAGIRTQIVGSRARHSAVELPIQLGAEDRVSVESCAISRSEIKKLWGGCPVLSGSAGSQDQHARLIRYSRHMGAGGSRRPASKARPLAQTPENTLLRGYSLTVFRDFYTMESPQLIATPIDVVGVPQDSQTAL